MVQYCALLMYNGNNHIYKIYFMKDEEAFKDTDKSSCSNSSSTSQLSTIKLAYFHTTNKLI